MPGSTALPIDPLREPLLAALEGGPVVLSAPTGSGKSTQVPRWLQTRGKVLVVEPRRVACQSLAARVAHLEGTELGAGVGYIVRDDRRVGAQTRVQFVTPGVALRMVSSGDLDRFGTLVLDEFHERPLDLDLLLALSLRRARTGPAPGLVVMSATLQGDRIAAHLGGQHLEGEGRLHPVAVDHVAGGTVLPSADGLAERLKQAVQRAGSMAGDILVFLPGKAEIAAAAAALGGSPHQVLGLHGGLSLREQGRIFQPGAKRRVVLSTNVAETSLTIPRIGVVIDSGLVRRTRYRNGRGSLTLLPIAQDSADQRAGRAGRLGPGTCLRLWAPHARLQAFTPPEIHREELTELVLAAAACQSDPAALPFLDPPKAHALDHARQTLVQLGALDTDHQTLTDQGGRLFGLPLDAAMGRLLVEAKSQGTLDDVLPLVAALSTPRRLFAARPEDPGDDLRDAGCDATALIRAVREGHPGQHRLFADGLQAARRAAQRYARALGEPAPDLGPSARAIPVDRPALARTLLAAWPRCAHVARRRKRHTAWANGGTELELGRDSCVPAEAHPAVLVLDVRQIGIKATKDRLVITAAMPLPLKWLADAGLGRPRVSAPSLHKGRVLARIEQVYAGKVLATTETTPTGPALHQAVCALVLRGSLFKPVAKALPDRHAARSLHQSLSGHPPLPPPEDWLLARIQELGLEDPEDLALLEPEDLLPAALPPHEQAQLDREFPRLLNTGDARYRLRYDPGTKTVTLEQTSGTRRDPPDKAYLPRLKGWGIEWLYKGRRRKLR